MKNIVTIKVMFNSRLNDRMLKNPTFLQCFDRIAEIKAGTAQPDKVYQFNTNHSHKGQIERMYNVFGCVDIVWCNDIKLS